MASARTPEPAAGERVAGTAPAGRRPEGVRRFSYHRQELPLLGAFVVIVAMELLLVHLLASQWSPRAAWALSTATSLVLVHIALLVRAMIVRPILVDDRGVTVCCGLTTEVFLPFDVLERLEIGTARPAPAARAALRTTLFAVPNMTLRLAGPVALQRLGSRRLVDQIVLRVDEPDAFRADIEARRSGAEMSASGARPPPSAA